MRKVLRGYATDKNGSLILIGTIPVPNSKDKCPPGRSSGKETFSQAGRNDFQRRGGSLITLVSNVVGIA